MATLYIMTEPPTTIEYSVKTGEVSEFSLRGKVLLDINKKISTDGWEAQLVRFVKEHRLNKPNPRGLHAFMYPLYDKGLLP